MLFPEAVKEVDCGMLHHCNLCTMFRPCSDLRYTLVVLVMFLISSILGPVLWYLWIHAGSANANFFFAMTLTYALAQVCTYMYYI